MNLNKYIHQAKLTSFGLKKLNLILSFGIPFNKPHSIKVHAIKDYFVSTTIPFKRRNFNHIKGIHACALATTSEFASGLLLLSNLDLKKYRLIMENLEVQYHYQAKSACLAEAQSSKEWFDKNIFEPLLSKDKISIVNIVKTYDKDKHHICTAKITWQIKLWAQVKTKL